MFLKDPFTRAISWPNVQRQFRCTIIPPTETTVCQRVTQVLQFLHLRISFLSPRNTPWHFREYIFYHPTLKIFKIYRSIKEMDPSIYEWCPSAILQTSWLIRKDCSVSSWNWSLWKNSSSHWITTRIRKVLSLASPFLQTESKTFWFPFVPLIKLFSLSAKLTILHLVLWCQSWGSAKHISVSLSIVKAIRLCNRRH